jgi:hypothetical protein
MNGSQDGGAFFGCQEKTEKGVKGAVSVQPFYGKKIDSGEK